MSAVVPFRGQARQLDAPSSPDPQISEDEVTVPLKLVRFLLQLLKDVGVLRRRYQPTFIDFEDWPFTADGFAKPYRLIHNFNGRVRWTVVDWQGADHDKLVRSSTSDDNTLVLLSNEAGTGTIRVELAG